MQKQAVISGGSKGIGLAICAELLREGFKVYSISRTLGEGALLKAAHGDNYIHIEADLSLKEDVFMAANRIAEYTQTVDVLVNNAGVFLPGTVETESDADFELQMQLNMHAPYYLTKRLLPLVRRSESGYIFNVCSTASIMAYPNGSAYCISKHALLGFSRVLRASLKSEGVMVSAVIPGATDTDSWKGSGLPKARFIKPETIASAVMCAWRARNDADFEEILIRPKAGDI